MGYSFKNGQFEAWSPYFDTTKFDESINIPLPKNRKYILLNEKNLTKYKDVLITDDNGINFSNDVFNINSFLESNGINDSSFLDKFIAITNELNKNEYKYIYSEDNYLLKAINRHESYYNENGFKNYIVNKMIGVLESPTTQVASNIPVTSGVYGEIKKNYSDSPYNLDVYNGYTMGLQQEQNTVGKAVIGIAAVGLKNYFALVKYFGNYYMNVDNIDVNSSKYFFKHYVINGKEYCFNKIAGLNNYKNIQDKLDEILVQNIRTSLESISKDTILSEYMSNSEYIDYIISSMEKLSLDNDIAFYISAILTLATDNAKELLLAKINAGIEFAGMHIYLLILGVSPDEVTKFMTSPEAMELKRKTENNIFITNGRPVSRINMIRASIDKNIKALPINEYRSNFFVNFFNIFMDSQELITLGSFLSVNQGSKANEESLYELLNNLRFSLVNQRKMLKRKYFNDLSDLETIKKDKP